MKTLKRMMVALLALLPFAAGVAIADTGHGYSRMFVFGASFLDSGNHFAVTGETAHPPFELISPASYGIGGHHFSNGRTWIEVLAQEMELTEWAKPAYRDPAFGNYAYGYARAREVDYAVSPSLGDQVQAWMDNGHCTGASMNDTLFVVDSGFFDLLDILQGEDPFLILPAMSDSIAANIGNLYGCGARNLLIAKLPPMGASPLVPDADKAATNGLSAFYNLYVQGVADFYSGFMNVSTLDLFTLTTAVVAMPEAFGFTNVTDSCLQFGVVKGAFCKDRNEHFFWDPLHPTKEAHALFATEALAVLPVPD